MEITVSGAPGIAINNHSRANSTRAAEICEIKSQIEQLRQDVYDEKPQTDIKEIKKNDILSFNTSENPAREDKVNGINTIGAALAGFTAGYVAGEIHKNIELSIKESALPEENQISKDLPDKVAVKNMIHKSAEQFFMDNIILKEYNMQKVRHHKFLFLEEYSPGESNMEGTSPREGYMIDINGNGLADWHEERSGFLSKSSPIIDDEPRLDVPIEKLNDFLNRNKDSVSYDGLLTSDDIGEIATHREKYDKGIITSFDRKTLTEVVNEQHPREKDVRWAFSNKSSNIVVYTPVNRI